jgi:hypothetical protein
MANLRVGDLVTYKVPEDEWEGDYSEWFLALCEEKAIGRVDSLGITTCSTTLIKVSDRVLEMKHSSANVFGSIHEVEKVQSIKKF